MRIVRYLKNSKIAVALIVCLLIVQAFTDLALPNYTSQIVDVGIQQSGVEHAATEEMTARTHDLVAMMLPEGDEKTFEAAYDETVSVMSKIPEGDRAKVAYLLGDKGTNTIAKNSYQGQVIDLVADNVADLGKVSGSGAGVEIGMEQLAIWDPAVILFGPDSIYDTVGSDAAFADLSAIKNGSYYKVPGTPWNWLNSPPTVNQVLGMQWLPRLLYPEQYDNDLYKTVAGYFKTFYGYDLSESEFNEIAANARPKA